MKLNIKTNLLYPLVILTSFTSTAHATVYGVSEDVMTSGFFGGPDFVRGYDADDRNVHRVSTELPFGTAAAETLYLDFSAIDLSAFMGNTVNATLTVTSADGGFNNNAGPGNPFTVSAHGVNANPLSSIIDDTNLGGTINWDDFYNNNILTADTAATTIVDSFGLITFDVSSLVNDWLTGSNTFTTIALTGKNHLASTEFLHGFLNNSENPGASFLEVTTVPVPAAVWLFGSGLIGIVGIARRKNS